MTEIKPLNREFIRKGFIYSQIISKPHGYIYKVDAQGHIFYEVFRHRINERFGCVSYPGGEAFGDWAWTFSNFEDADKCLNKLE
jgi:hypothetical protein